VEGWVEGPCAEGADLRGINQLMIDFFDDPQFVGDLFSFTYEMGLDFAKAQLTAGADIIGVGDAAASLIGPELYHQFVYPYEKKLVDGIHDAGGMVRLHICGNISSIIKSVSSLGCEIVDIDYPVDLSWAREQAGPDQILLGNIDPVKVLRDGTPGTVAEHLSACMAAAAPNWIAGAGCEVTGDTPHENLTAMSIFARGHGNSNYKY
jgi:MtaA/CmuA family methyltransferase